MKKRVLSMLMTLALCLTLFPAPAWAAEDTPEGGAIVQQEQQEEAPAEETDTPEIGATVQQEQQEEQQEAPAAEPSTILEQAAENGIAVQDSEDSTVENAVAEVTVNGSTTPYTDIDAAFAAAQEADSATVKLLADVTISHDDYSGIALKKGNITLDLNGKTLSKSKRDDNWFYAKNAVFWLLPPEATTKDEFLAALRMPVRLTVQDSSADENGKIVQPNGGPAVTATLNTILTVNGGTIENASSVDLDDDSHMKPNCAVLLSGGSKAVINGGTLRGMRGVAVTGYITKEVEGLYKDTFGIEGYNNDTYGNELTVTGGNICATSGEGLIVYEKAKKIELSGGTFTTQSNAYSIWVADTKDGEQTFKGDASSLLASGCRYENNGTECVYSEDGKGVTGNATVALRPANEYAYIDKNGNLATQANCTEITERTDDISTPGWYVVKENVTISGLNISGEVNLILCDGATLTVTSFMNVTQGRTLNLYWQSAGTGKLTAAAISVLGTVTAPAGEMKRTTGEGGTTFEKCFEHDWGYTNNGDTHTAMCKLCGKAEAAESHKYDSWAPTDANIHTGTCACGATKTEGHTLTCTPNADGLTHSTKCSVCGYTAAAESHDFNQTDNYGKKCACGAYLAAECNGQQYATLARAIEAANGADITLLTIVSENVVVDGASIKAGIILGNGKTIDDIPYPSNWVADRNGIPLTMEAGEITLKDGALAQFTGYASANNAIALKGGTLTVADTVTKIIGSVASESGQRAAIEATGGVLDLQGNTLLDGGLTMSGDAQLKNKLTAGTFTNSGSETYSVSVEGSSQYTTVFDLLETGYAFAVYNKDAPTGDVIAKDTTTRELTEDVAVIKCTHKGANNKSLFKDNTCTGCGFTCAHETVENGVCTVCKQQMKAKASASDGTEQYYLDLQEAFEGVADGGTVTMLTTLTDDDTISFCCDAEGNPVEKTVTLMMNGHSLSYEGASSLNIQSGKLIIGDEVTISQPATAAVPAVFVDNNEQSKDRGTLEFKGKANLTGGLLIQNWGKLEGGLKEGTIITSNGTYSVSVERSETYSNVLGLLGDGLAFAKKDHPDKLVNGNVKQLTEDVIVVAHKHSPKYTQNPDPDALQTYIYICDCGFVCPHDRFTNSICDICHAACTHDEYTSDDKCARCGAPFAVRVECTDSVGITSNKLYMKTTTQDGTDDTLRQVFNEAADGSTITLLANGTLPRGIYASKTLTLNLNGHSLSGYSLNVGGLTATGQPRTGNLTVIDSSGGNGAVGVTVGDGGTLVFDPKNDSTTLLQLEVWGGKVELHGGKILRKGLRLNNNITLGDLLPQKAGLAYYCGDTQLTLEEAASKSCDLVVKSCAHGGKNGFDKNATACPYCNAPAVAETALNNGEGRRFADLQTALDADRDGGATLQLLTDVTGDYTINGTQDTGLDLNGHSIKGTVTVKGTLTTTLSNTENTTTVSIDNVVAYKGAKLAGSGYPAVIGTLTLADGATWKNILNLKTLGYKVLNGEGTHQWYAPNDVKGSQLNNVIINSLPITTKTLNLKVNGTNVNKVERGTTVQLCASCNTNGADVTFSILKKGETTPITLTKPSYAGGKYTKDYSFDTIGEYTIYFTATKDGYSVQSAEKKLTVTKATIPASVITAPAANALTYNGNEQVLVKAGSVGAEYGEMQYRLGTSGSFSTAIPTATDAGTYTVYYKVVGAEGYNDTTAKSIEVTISPVKIKGIGNVASVSKTYDGSASVTLPKTNLAFLDAAGSTISLPESAYTITDARFTTRQDDSIYEDSPNAGTKEAISFTLTLTDSNYVFEGEAANARSANFNFTTNDDRFQINQATVTPAEITLFVYNDMAKTYTLNLATRLPELTQGCEYGEIQYQECTYNFTDRTYLDSKNGMSVSNEGVLTLPIVAAHSAVANKQIGTITAPVVTANYQQFELTIKVVIGEKITPVQSDDFKISATGITYRQTLENSTLTVKGTMKDPTTQEEVKGTFAWKNKYDLPINTGDVYFDWTFTPDESYGGIYAAVTDIVKVPVAPKSIEGATITLEKDEFAYNAAEQSPKITGVTLENWDETRITYVIKSGDKATDVSDRITLTIEGTGNYTGRATVEWKITPKTVKPTIEVASCTYTGDALEPTVTVKDDIGNIIDQKEYEIFYSNNTNAGTATVTIKDVDGGNYVFSEASKTFEITKAAAPTAAAGSLTITNGLHKTYSLDLSTLLPKLTAPCDYGTITYDKKVDTTLGSGTFVTLVNSKTGELTLEANRSATDEGQFGTITVTISTSNYQDITLTVNVSAVNQIRPMPDGEITATPITYGDILSKSEISGKMKDPDTGDAVNGTFTWMDGTVKPDAGSNNATWTFTPDASYGGKYTTNTGTATVTVNRKTVMVSGITASDKVYDGTTNAKLNFSNAKFAGILENDTLTVTAKGVFEKADIGKQKVKISNFKLGGDSAANYVLAESGNQTETTATITAKEVTVTITPNGGTYGSVVAAAAELSGAVKGENIPVTLTYTGNGYDATAVPVNVGSYTVTASIANSNYTLTGKTTADFVITPKAVTVSGITAKDKVYDGTTDATLDCSNAKFDGILKNDKLTVAAKGMFEKAVAGKQNVAISGLTLGGASAANYVLAESGNQTETTANITAKQITVTITPNGGTYGSVVAAAAKLSGAVAGENIPVTLTYTGNNYSSATVPVNAGSYKVTASIANSNYTLTGNTTADFVITPKTVTVSGITAKDKVYDGTNDATLDCSNAKFDGILKNDKLTVAAKGMFEKAVAGKQNVAISGLTLGGASAANYVLAERGNQTETTATITAKEVTVTITSNGGTYGSVVAAAAKLTGAVDGDNVPVTLTYTGNGYNDTAVPVNAGSYTVTASIANSNYTLTENTTANFVITPKPVTVTGITANDKVYDGTTDAKLNFSNAKFAGILENDKLTVAAKGMFEKAEAGKQNVAISDLELGGDSVANYVLAESGNQAETTATITAKQVTVTITPNGGTYGSVIAAAANLSGAVKGENVPVTLTYTGTANDGTEYNGTTPPTKAGTYTITATITDPNYKLDADTATAEFTVAKRPATVTPDNKSKVYEEKDPELTYKVSGVLDGETLEGITLARAKGENAGKYAITVTADVSANPNYDVTFAEGTFTIEPKSIKDATVVLGKGLAANGAEQTQTVEKVLLGDKEIPADSYTVTGNTATAHGIYTLTITAKGNYTDSIAWTYVIAPSKAEDAPGEDITIGSGKVKVVVLPEGAVPSVGLLTDKAELLAMLVNSGDITADELVQIANGASVDIVLTVKKANVPDAVKTAMAQAAKDYTIGQYLDISLFKYMTVNGKRQPGVALHTSTNALTISVVVQDALINTNSAVNRTYCIVRNP